MSRYLLDMYFSLSEQSRGINETQRAQAQCVRTCGALYSYVQSRARGAMSIYSHTLWLLVLHLHLSALSAARQGGMYTSTDVMFRHDRPQIFWYLYVGTTR